MNNGVGYIFENSKGQILLMLRDNKKSIPFPNFWYIPGGGILDNEDPLSAVIREVEEELGIKVNGFQLFKEYLGKKREYIFYKKFDLAINQIKLNEGQEVRFFDKEEVLKMNLAFNDNTIVRDYFSK